MRIEAIGAFGLILIPSAMCFQRSIPTADRISELPDSVLCHILSFIPTKLAAATSVLSKRWKPVWLSVLALDFDDQTFIDFFSFRHFVSSVILSRDITLPIRSFRLKCGNSSPFDPHDVNRFVCAAVQRGIEDLNLDMSYMRFEILEKLAPSVLSVLSCRTLVVLKLKNLSMYDVPQVDFPLLKTLHLHRIYFLRHYGHLKRLLYGCPILENLQTNHLIIMRMGYKSEGMFEGLTKLVRANISNSGQNVPFAWVHNAKFLRAELKRTYEYQVPTFHNLTNMELIFESKIWLGKWKLVIEVLDHCPKLQNLIIDEASKNVQVIGNEDWKDPETVPECLSSQLRTCSLRDYKGFKCELQFAEYIMKNSKLLCTMTIESTCSVDGNAKHQMLVKLSSCPRGSETCRLLFD